MSAEPYEVQDDQGVGRSMPHDIDAEQSVLGALLIAPRYVDEVAASIRPGDFYRPSHQIIASVIYDLNARGEAIDAVTVLDALARRGEPTRVGGAAYLHTLTAVVPTAANVGYYVRIVRERAQLRGLIEAGTRIASYGYTGDGDGVEALLAQAHQDLLAVEAGDVDDLVGVDALMPDLLDGLERGDTSDRVPLPYLDLNELLGGLKGGQLVIVGARPAVGKSVVALDIARHAALRCGLPVFFASLEMSARELGRRMLAAEGRVMLDHLENNQLTEEDWQKVTEAGARIAESPHLVIDETPNVSVERLRARLRKMARSEVGAARLLIVDYLQLMRPLAVSGRKSPENRQVEVAEMSRDLKLLAKEFDIPVVVLAQLNRGVEQRAEKKPMISDLRESGALEQDADVVILLSREADQESSARGELDLIVGKNRAGRTGVVSVAFQGHHARAVDMYRPDRPAPKAAPHLRAIPSP
ncbi:replicative DNA helicase [Streptosporangium sp. CA-115845]|uniref:replicative DNA helicase n=1 Tax=Streptosporangium sp. CA-115845 TaxID=3240071 RepID=UPI003D8FE7FC